ncbi:phage hypothetical protein [Enterococcus faecium 13.SD.W.09]|nr:phage hypothetical protein [Enterococcus faecium 13.SD.W.09]
MHDVLQIDLSRSMVSLKIENASEWYWFKEVVLMQSTGLKDKNGVGIFEGDVLTSNVQPCKMVNPIKDGYGVVRFENGMFKLGAISLVTFISKMEVVGNIYENPELLEQANEN